MPPMGGRERERLSGLQSMGALERDLLMARQSMGTSLFIGAPVLVPRSMAQ